MTSALKVLLFLGALASFHAEDDAPQQDMTEEELPEQDPEDEAKTLGEEEEFVSVQQLKDLHGKIDANGDGMVSISEIMALSDTVNKANVGKDIKSIMEDMEAMKDGKFTLEEYMTDISAETSGESEEEKKELEDRKTHETAKFKLADSNGDGHLEESELSALFYPETHAGVWKLSLEESMKTKDADKDGKLDIAEFFESGDEELPQEDKDEFKMLDKNGDGFIDLKELGPWESGKFHTEKTMKKHVKLMDADGDDKLTVDEFADGDRLQNSEAHYHLAEWVKHHEL